jgi:DNA-binding XRE family transcriptional regulator
MKVITLYENTGCRDDVIVGHGLSQYIETANHRILLDMGRNGDFITNAEALGVERATVTMWEIGSTWPSARVLPKIADLLLVEGIGEHRLDAIIDDITI